MADVGSQSRRGTDRGQLILVVGLLAAVAMVSLVLLLNTAIYTENLASRGVDQSGREAIELRGVVVAEVGRLVDAENAREPGSWSTVRDTTRRGILVVDNYTARTNAARGTAVAVNRSSLTLHRGQRIRQTNASRNFTDASNTGTDWRLASSVEDVRAFSITVDDSKLNTTSEGQATVHDPFTVAVSDGGSTWQAFVYKQSDGDIALATKAPGEVTDELCFVSAIEATVNLSAGTLSGQPCAGYVWAEGVSPPYEIRFENGHNATGTYGLTINGTGADGTNLNSDAPSPYFTPAVYSVTFDLYYETPTLVYRAPVRVAPGEPS